MQRRRFLSAMLASASLPAAGCAAAGDPAYLAAARTASGTFELFLLDETGDDIFSIPLPDRGHAAAAHPVMAEAVAFARRPGTFALVIDCLRGKLIRELEAPEGRHFYGHGVFIAGGDVLCTPENAYESGEGRIGLWSRSEGWRRIGEIPSHGTGPHDIRRLPGDVLVVANGGIRTHPDAGREKLNIDTMQPNLSYLTGQGELLDQVTLPEELHQNSIRHLALGPDGTVAFAMQWQGEVTDGVPLLGLHRRGAPVQLADLPLSEAIAMKGYAGSVAFDGAGNRVAITSPRGGRVQIFGNDGSHLETIRRSDVCGAAPSAAGFLFSDGMGGLLELGEQLRPLQSRPGRAWDNHVVSLRNATT